MNFKRFLIGTTIMTSVAFYTAFGGALQASAQNIDVSQFKQVIELFIALGIIAPDKVEQVRTAFGITVPIAVSTSTPIFGVSGSNVNNPDVTNGPVVGGITTIVSSYSKVTRVALGNVYCSSDVSVGIPVNIDGTDWSKVSFSYNGYGVTAEHNGVQGIQVTIPQNQELEITNRVTNNRLAGNLSTTTPVIYINNVPGSYQFTGVVYDTNGHVVSNVPLQTVTVSNACRTTMSDIKIPIDHGNGTYNGQLQSDGSWINTTTIWPYKN